MPISSYLGFPREGLKSEKILASFQNIPHCEVEISGQGECIVLITDTPTAEQEEILRQRLESISELACLSLVFAADNGEVTL